MPDIIITPNSGLIDFFPVSSRVSRIEASGNTFNLVNTANPSGIIFNIDATNGSLFSVVDNLSGTLMSVNNNAGLPVFEVFSDDRIVGGRFGQNDLVVTSGGNIGLGISTPSGKLHVIGDVTASGFVASSGTAAAPSYDFVNDPDTGIFSPAANTLGISTSGVERLRIANNGRIGIGGITNPNTTFHVNGSGLFSQRLGIGSISTISPAYPLHVMGTINVDGLAINNVFTLNPDTYSMDMTDGNPVSIFQFGPDVCYFMSQNSAYGLYYDRVTEYVGINTPNAAHSLDVNGNIRCRKLYLESVSSSSIVSSGLTLNLDNSQLFTVNLNSNITTVTISNTPSTSGTAVGFSLIFTADGTARSVTWPTGVKWAGGSSPTLTSTSGKMDVLSFVTTNGGTNWLGFVGGQNY